MLGATTGKQSEAGCYTHQGVEPSVARPERDDK
jgi:hypothetical protein